MSKKTIDLICSFCGAGTLEPVHFIEEELDNLGLKTGRKRLAVSHLECPTCGHKATVDDSLDGPWHE